MANTNAAAISLAADWFKATLQNTTGAVEIIYVRTRALGSGVLSNVLRAQEGTAALTLIAGDICSLRMTAVDLADAVSFASGASTFWKTLVGWTNQALSRVALGATTVGDALFTAASAAAARATLGVTSEIQPISASVAANALTISASELSLDFRSPTGTSGVVTRVTGTPAPLVISSGSNLGTVAGVDFRIYILAINNSGVIELAAINAPSGYELDETTAISTAAEGGSGLADIASVAYSTTARSNVSYRVIGYLTSNQATAGLWATQPNIQGVGGEALKGDDRPGPWNTTTLALGTTYTNRLTKRIFLSVDGVYSAGASTSWTVGGYATLGRTVNTGGVSNTMSTQMTVGRGETYRLNLIGGTVTSIVASIS